MCLYPKLVRNPRYKKNKKNGGVIPPVFDNRHLYIPVGCQVCKECRKRKARDWQVRLQEEIKTNSNGHMITFTFSTEGLQKITDNYPEIAELEGYEKDNAIAKKGLRLFLENWRKKHKKSVRHWAITELGHQGTEHVHIHALIWTNQPVEEIQKHWHHGMTWGGYKDDRTNKVIRMSTSPISIMINNNRYHKLNTNILNLNTSY